MRNVTDQLDTPTIVTLEHPQPRRKLIQWTARMLHYQGLWPEGLDPNLSPPFARLLKKHNRLRQGFNCLRHIYPWILIGVMLLDVFILHPIAIYHNWEEKIRVIESVYAIFIYITVIVSVISGICFLNRFAQNTEHFEEMFDRHNLDNQEQVDIVDSMLATCSKLETLSTLWSALFSVIIALYSTFELRPKRELLLSEWYPYETNASPAYEVTLYLRSVHLIMIMVTANTLCISVICYFIYLDTSFEILCNKLRNIQTISVQNVNSKSHLCETTSRISREEFMVQEEENYKINRSGTLTKGEESHQKFESLNAIEVLPHSLMMNSLPQYECNIPGSVLDGSTEMPIVQVHGTHVIPITETHVLIHKRRETNRTEIFKENVTKFTKEGIHAKRIETEMKIHLKMYVKIHQEMLRIASDVEKTIKYVVLVIFTYNIIGLGITIKLVESAGNDLGMREIIGIMVSCELALAFLIFNYLANNVADRSSAVGEAIYDCDWLGTSTSFKRSMVIIMSRANVPVEFKSPGLDPLSLRSFGEAANIAYKLTARINTFVKSQG